MAPLKPIKNDANDKRLRAVLDFAQKLSTLLRNRDQIEPGVEEQLETSVKRVFPLPSTTSLAGKLPDFDTYGCELWNAATNLLRNEQTGGTAHVHHKPNDRTIVLLRVFAFFLLDTACHGSTEHSQNHEQRLRNFKIGLKACRFCLDKSALELALTVLERCSEHVSAAEIDSPLVRISGTGEDKFEQIQRLRVAEFYLLRMTHAWKSERLDLAEHFFNKYASSQTAGSCPLAENAADLLYEAGKSLHRKKLLDSSVRWLERALQSLDACDIEQLSQNAPDLRLSITATLVEILLSAVTAESVERAQKLVEQLSTTHGFADRMVVHLMQLNVLLAKNSVPACELANVISRLLRAAVLTDKTFKTTSIMRAIHRIQRVNAQVALDALSELITTRLLPDVTPDQSADGPLQDRIEKTCVTFVLFATTAPGAASLHAINGLLAILDGVAQRSKKPFTAKATHAAQTLLWKAAGAAKSEIADRWCIILRNPVFDSAGHINKGRIGRKSMIMAMDKNNFNAARQAFFQMPTTAQSDSLTRYLAFKLALRSNDYDFAVESLNVVMKYADNDDTFLYACVLEAQQCEMRHLAVVALQTLLDKQPPQVHVPSLLRCAARLLVGELESSQRDQGQVIDEVVRIFEYAIENLQTFKKGTSDQWRAEVQWWSKNAYNISVQYCADIHPEQLVRMLGICTKFVECYPDDAGPMHQDSLHSRKALCHFLSASACVVLGRSSAEGSEYSLQCYLQARQEIASFRSMSVAKGDKASIETTKRSFELLKFDLECVLILQQWDELNDVLQNCMSIEDVDRWDTLADIVLILREQAGPAGLDDNSKGSMTELLQRIINDTWHRDKNLDKAARWLRLSFTVDMTDGDGQFALRLLDQAATMAKKGVISGTAPFPENELEWLATTAFNRCVDFVSAQERNGFERWSNGALELARHAADNGALHANLTCKRALAVERMGAMEM